MGAVRSDPWVGLARQGTAGSNTFDTRLNYTTFIGLNGDQNYCILK